MSAAPLWGKDYAALSHNQAHIQGVAQGTVSFDGLSSLPHLWHFVIGANPTPTPPETESWLCACPQQPSLHTTHVACLSNSVGDHRHLRF